MRLTAFAFIMVTALMASPQDEYPWEKTPWQAGQPEAPPGWACTPMGYVKDGVQTTDHPCTCARMGYGDEGEGEGCAPAHPPAGCKTYCKSDACGCPVTCVHQP